MRKIIRLTERVDSHEIIYEADTVEEIMNLKTAVNPTVLITQNITCSDPAKIGDMLRSALNSAGVVGSLI